MTTLRRQQTDTTLANLPDVDFSTPPTNGQVLKYNSTQQKWLPGTDLSGGGGGGPNTISVLSVNYPVGSPASPLEFAQEVGYELIDYTFTSGQLNTAKFIRFFWQGQWSVENLANEAVDVRLVFYDVIQEIERNIKLGSGTIQNVGTFFGISFDISTSLITRTIINGQFLIAAQTSSDFLSPNKFVNRFAVSPETFSAYLDGPDTINWGNSQRIRLLVTQTGGFGSPSDASTLYEYSSVLELVE